jgi:hypothetical protein
MIIQTAVICDAATAYLDKLNLLGAFDTIHASSMPAVHPSCSVALRIIFERIEEGHHLLKLNLVDEDGKLLVPKMELPIHAPMPPDANFLSRNCIINFQNLKFEKPGYYSIDVALDNRHLTSIPLAVKLHAAPGDAHAAPPPASQP